MNLRLYDKQNNLLIEREYPLKLTQKEPLIENSIQFSEHYATGTYKEICFNGVHISIGTTHFEKPLSLSFDSDFKTIEMHFALKGRSLSTTNKRKQTVEFSPYQHNIIYSDNNAGQIQWTEKDLYLCEINLTPEFFLKYLPQDNQLFDRFHNLITKEKSGLLSPVNQAITPLMYQLIVDIIQCNRSGAFKRMYIEAKVIELLLIQLEQLSLRHQKPLSINKTDIEKIQAVKDYIINNLDAEDSLIDLAHRVGTNEFTLKKGFKELFGTTVFGLWNQQKLEQAKRLLTNQQISISEVAYLLGYKNPRHFSTAFKNKFGCSPSAFKQK
ncbi:AraC family transcriptional regulator [Myroides pelagicus]|uniref:helix-turn-helix domain-containing protein n=1 Tax=Myroides pelagicus TaxID=270914 RepID=UPI002DBD9012|nr:AraC family transcriptional regulator [Myroides pelagicus]MEC4113412.1 AraC family transcriptional regulator [Myroides pelagicus]